MIERNLRGQVNERAGPGRQQRPGFFMPGSRRDVMNHYTFKTVAGQPLLPIAAFQLVGYSAWNGEDAGSSPACYTVRSSNGKDTGFSFL